MQRVIGAVADGDLSKKVSADVRGEMLELKNTINAMVDQLNGFISEVTRVAREVGTEGKLGQAAAVTIEVGGVWKDLTDNVNLMAGNLTGQVRNIAEVTTAVANGDLSKKISIDVKGEFLELKNTVNAMVDQLNAFAGEVTRVAREVGVEGKLGGQAQSKEVGGVWKDLTDNVNQLAANLTNQVRAIAEVATAVTEGDLTRQVSVEASGEVAVLKDKLNEMIRNLRETTRQNVEQDWLKTNRERFTRMLQGQDDLTDVSSMILSELATLVSAQHGVFYAMTGPSDDGEPRAGAAGRLRLRGAQAPLDVLPARRGPGRPVRQGEEADPAHRRPRRLREDQLGTRRGAAAQHHRPAGPVRGVAARRRRARLVLAVQHHASDVPRLDHREHRHRPQHDPGGRLTEALLKQSQSQAEELRSQQEELRESNEDLGRQARLLAEQNIVAEQKNLEVEESKRLVEEKVSQLAVSSKYKSEFIANMSHELRTPLNSLLILAQQLEDNPDHNLTDTQVEYASVIHSSGKELLELLNSILDLAKVESGTVTAELTDLSVDELRTALLREFEPVAPGRRASSYTIDVAPGTPRRHRHRPPAAAPDPQEPARQRVQVHRARRGARPDRPGRRRAGARMESLASAPSVVAFSVSDTGIGIDDEQQQRIFEAFAQGDGTTARLYGGTGLGLSISRELVGLLGGELSVASTPGQGSTFTVYLPAGAPRDAPAPSAAGASGAPPSPGSRATAASVPEPRPAVRRRAPANGRGRPVHRRREVPRRRRRPPQRLRDDGAARTRPRRGDGRRERGRGHRRARARRPTSTSS